MCWNKALWLDITSHMTYSNQVEGFVSVYCSYDTLKFVYDIAAGQNEPCEFQNKIIYSRTSSVLKALKVFKRFPRWQFSVKSSFNSTPKIISLSSGFRWKMVLLFYFHKLHLTLEKKCFKYFPPNFQSIENILKLNYF